MILIDVTFTNACGSTLLDRSARWGGYAILEAASRTKNNKYRGAFASIWYHLAPLAISTYGDIGPDA